jgi:3-methylfumaryl-CoA hydratase
MWAGGRIRTSGSLRCGESATKQTRLLSVQEKLGRSGPLTFFIVEHKILQRGRTVIDEQQDIVYRESAPSPGQLPLLAGDEPVVPPADGEWMIEVSPTLLFRFSALTYNAHRIHYDRDYARDVEGYPGLLTHGPLQALAMAEAARTMESCRDGQHSDLYFDYRLTSPLFDHQAMIVSATQDQGSTVMAVRDIYGRQTAAATLRR